MARRSNGDSKTPSTNQLGKGQGPANDSEKSRPGGPDNDKGDIPDPEVCEKPIRRRFSAKYKAGVLREADSCKKLGELGALLRREGLYHSHLTTWRRQREEGTLAALSAKTRGRKGRRRDPKEAEIKRLQREVDRLKHELNKAETIIEVQKKLSELLGKSPDRTEKP